jgi:hypothetical protein
MAATPPVRIAQQLTVAPFIEPVDPRKDANPPQHSQSPGRGPRTLALPAAPPSNEQEAIFHQVHQDAAAPRKDDHVVLPRRTIEAITQLVRETGLTTHGQLNLNQEKVMTSWPSTQSEAGKKPQLMLLLDTYMRDHKILVGKLVNPSPDTTGVLYADAVHHICKKLGKHFPAYAEAFNFVENAADSIVEFAVIAMNTAKEQQRARHELATEFDHFKTKRDNQVKQLEQLLQNAKKAIDESAAIDDERALLRAMNDEYAKKQSGIRTAAEQMRMERDEAQGRIGVHKFRENMQNEKIKKLEAECQQLSTALQLAQIAVVEKTKACTHAEEQLFKQEREFIKELDFYKKIAANVDEMSSAVSNLRQENEDLHKMIAKEQLARVKSKTRLDLSAVSEKNEHSSPRGSPLAPSQAGAFAAHGDATIVEKAKEAAFNAAQKTPRPNWSAFDSLAKSEGFKLDATPNPSVGGNPKVTSATRVNVFVDTYCALKERYTELYAIVSALIAEESAMRQAPGNHGEYRQAVLSGDPAAVAAFPQVSSHDAESLLKKNDLVRQAGKKAQQFLAAAANEVELAKHNQSQQQLAEQPEVPAPAIFISSDAFTGSKTSAAHAGLSPAAPSALPAAPAAGGGRRKSSVSRKKSEVILQFPPVDMEQVTAIQHARTLLLHLPATHIVLSKEDLLSHVNRVFDTISLRYRVFEKRTPPAGSNSNNNPTAGFSASVLAPEASGTFSSPTGPVSPGTSLNATGQQVVPLPQLGGAAAAFTLGGVDGVAGLLNGMDEATALAFYRSAFFSTTFAEDFRQCAEFVLAPIIMPAPPAVPVTVTAAAALSGNSSLPFGYNGGPQSAAASIIRSILYYAQRMEATHPLLKFFLLHVDGVVPKTTFMHFREDVRRMNQLFLDIDRRATGYVGTLELMTKIEQQFRYLRGQDLFTIDRLASSSLAKLGAVERSIWQEPQQVVEKGLVLYANGNATQRLLHPDGPLVQTMLMAFCCAVIVNIDAMRMAIVSQNLRGSELPFNTVMQALERADPDLTDTERRTFIAVCTDIPVACFSARVKVPTNKLCKRIGEIFIRRATPLNSRDVVFHKISPFANVPRVVLHDTEVKVPAPPEEGDRRKGGAQRRRSTKGNAEA